MTPKPLVREIRVGLDFGPGVIPVGRLAARGRAIYFGYDREFIASGLDISPLRLPLTSGVTTSASDLFEGLPGVFNDSLPDGWGRLLFDRLARSRGLDLAEITPLDRLAHVGGHGLGALVYEPDHSAAESVEAICLDLLAEQTQEVLRGAADDVLQELLTLNGSSAGARPKAQVGVGPAREDLVHGARDLPTGYTPWLVKFANSQDRDDVGAVEYVYALMAREAGIEVADVHLFSAREGAGYFSVRRFDREGARRFHMHTVCGLLHSDFRTPSLDYEDLIALTGALTRDASAVAEMYRRAVFNVLAHNRDDHAKNFSFLMDAEGQWRLSPAYDLTFSSGPGGEQSTMVMGEGRHPGLEHLTRLGHEANLKPAAIATIIDQTKTALGSWKKLAREHGVRAATIDEIAGRIL